MRFASILFLGIMMMELANGVPGRKGKGIKSFSVYGVQKISKIVINGSILITGFAVEKLDKNKHF